MTYTITLENTGNIPAANLIFSDTIPQDTTFVENSFTLNGTAILDANPNVGVTLPTLAANATHLISFQILINDSFSQESITNQSIQHIQSNQTQGNHLLLKHLLVISSLQISCKHN